MKEIQPPKFVRRLIKLFMNREQADAVCSNLDEEFFEIYENEGKRKSNGWYRRQVIKSIPRAIKFSIYWGVIMAGNYFKIAFRILQKNKGYSFINIFGLAIGIACCIIISFWIQDEFSYDQFHENKLTIFRVVQKWDNQPGEPGQEWIPGPVGPLLKQDYSEISESTRFINRERVQISTGTKGFINTGVIVDPSFFKMFSFPFLLGNSENALNNPNSIVISSSLATKMFGSVNPLGQTVQYNSKSDFIITGVFKDIPVNSHLQFDFCIPYSQSTAPYFHWSNNDHKVYVQLTNEDKRDLVNSKIAGILKKHQPRAKSILALQQLSDIHLYSLVGVDRITYIYIFSAMAIVVLLMACINFMNLATAKATKRAKEVGLRKVIGSNRNQLIIQFLSESIILALIAMLLGLLLSIFCLPFINGLVGHEIKIEFSSWIFLSIISITLFTGLVAGSYPAFFLSSFNPVTTLKGLQNSTGRTRVAVFRKILTIVQFSISIFFIISAISIYKQMSFTNKMDMGIDKDNIVLFDFKGELKDKYNTVKERLLQLSSVSSITSMDIPPLIPWNNTTDDVEWEGMGDNSRLSFSVKTIDYDFLKTFDAEMAAGRFFSKTITTDASDGYIINETAAAVMGLDSPVGTRVTLWGVTGRIIGVIKDFHIASLRNSIEPLILRIRENKANYACVRIIPGVVNHKNIIESIREVFDETIPAYSFNYSFLSDEYNTMYQEETLTNKITLIITLLMILISCLGLLGLASFMAEQKKKEIGMRKLLGASVKQIVIMLSNEFTKRIIIANIIAWPIAYYFVNKWLEDFAYRIELKYDIFIITGALSFLLALITVSYQSIKAASLNPIDCIKYE